MVPGLPEANHTLGRAPGSPGAECLVHFDSLVPWTWPRSLGWRESQAETQQAGRCSFHALCMRVVMAGHFSGAPLPALHPTHHPTDVSGAPPVGQALF